jgi:hypothetical protein
MATLVVARMKEEMPRGGGGGVGWGGVGWGGVGVRGGMVGDGVNGRPRRRARKLQARPGQKGTAPSHLHRAVHRVRQVVLCLKVREAPHQLHELRAGAGWAEEREG